MPIKYSNTGTRDMKLASDLEAILSKVSDQYGFTINVTSGGQDPNKKTTGSNRHNHGHAGDVEIYDPNGRQLIPTDPEHQQVLSPFIADLVRNGITSVGAGEGYMGGTRFHIDNAETHGQGVKGARYWGKTQSRDSAPQWLKDAVDTGYGQQVQKPNQGWLSNYSPQPVDNRTTASVNPYIPDQNIVLPSQPIQDMDYENWNPFGYVTGQILKQPIREVSETRKKQKQQVKSVADQLEDSPIKSAILTILDQEESTPSRRQDEGWLSNYRTTPKQSTSGKQGQYNAGNLRNSDGSFKSFSTPQEGRQALVDQLIRYQTGTNKVGVKPEHTLYEAMSIYAPASDRNNPKQYANFISNRIGVDPNTQIKDIDPSKWADAISVMEGNKSYLSSQKENGGWLSKYTK